MVDQNLSVFTAQPGAAIINFMLRLPEARIPQWLLVAGAWIFVTATLGLWVSLHEKTELQAHLVHLQFWTLESLFAVVSVLTVKHARSLWNLALDRQPATAPLVSLLAIVVAVLVLTTVVAPRTNRIYYDEQIYQNIGQNMSDSRRAQMCNDGSVEYGRLQCREAEYNKQPYGHPYLLSIAYRVAGTRDGAAHWLNTLWSALLVAAVFLTTALLFRDTLAGLFAALLMALIPEQLRWAATAAVEPAAAFFAAFAVMTAVYFVRTRTTSALLWVVSATAFAAQFRIESSLIVVVVALLVLSAAPDEVRRPRSCLAAALLLLLMSPLVGHMVAVSDDPWGAPGSRTSWSYVWLNLTVNGPFYFADERFPAVYALLALVGAVAARPRRAAAAMVGYFAGFFGVFLVFYAGSYNYGADVRFSLTTYPPVAILAGLGAAVVAGRLVAWGLSATSARAAVCAFILFQFSWYLPYVRAVGEEAWGARADVEFARRIASTIPDDGYVLSHNPNMFHVWGTSSAQTFVGVDRPGYVAELTRRYRGGVYFHWGFWCNVNDDVQRDLCRRVTETYDMELLAEHRRWNYRYAFYRIVSLVADDAKSARSGVPEVPVDAGKSGSVLRLPREDETNLTSRLIGLLKPT